MLEIIGAHGRDGASALDIGTGLTDGTVQGRHRGKAAKERLDLTVGSTLVQNRLVVATWGNRFMQAKLIENAVPPLVQREDMPSPGYRRIPPKHAPGPRRESSLLLAAMVFRGEETWGLCR